MSVWIAQRDANLVRVVGSSGGNLALFAGCKFRKIPVIISLPIENHY